VTEHPGTDPRQKEITDAAGPPREGELAETKEGRTSRREHVVYTAPRVRGENEGGN